MPVEIRELVIRAIVMPEPKKTHRQDGSKGKAAPAKVSNAPDAAIQECVQQVLRIIRKERGR